MNESATAITCPACGTQIAAGLLTCPSCNRLTFAEQLKQIAERAEQETQVGNLQNALILWREALDRLPPDSRQHQTILAKVNELSRRVDASPIAPMPIKTPSRSAQAGTKGAGGQTKGRWTVGAAILALLVKFKTVIFLVLAKAKFLLLGLSKLGTVWTMLLSFGFYWSIWGWKFALGFILSMYVHEMGHVAALRRFGIKATAPMFIPGFGALVRLKQLPANPIEDARIGLAGPWWGMGAAFACYVVFEVTNVPIWAAIAQTGAWLNLFNLLPIWQLDGGRGFNALSRWQAVAGAAVAGGMFAWTHEGLLMVIAALALYRAFTTPSSRAGDGQTLLEYGFLVVILAAMVFLLAPMTGQTL